MQVMKKRTIIFIILGVVVLILIGLFFIRDIQKENITDNNQESSGSIQKFGLGSLCSDEDECREFCLNNRGRCEEYCRGNENELCQIIFSLQQESESTDIVKDCISNPKPVFTAPFTDIAKISSVTQTGSNALYNPGSQARSYINMKYEPGTDIVPIYAPINSTLTGITYATRNLRTGTAKGEYRLDFKVSCEVRYAFDHLADITDKIKEFAPVVPANNTRLDRSVSIYIQAGELLGYTDRNIIGGNWDFVFINTAHESSHSNPERWISDHSNHADCPYDYFTPELKNKYYALIEKSDTEITCGPLLHDIPGTIAGYWFKDDANEDHGKRFGIYGGYHFVEFILANEKEFLFIRDGNPSRISPKQVTIGKGTCYFDNEKNAYAYLKLLSETELGLATGNGNCPSSFPQEFEVFER